MHSVAQFYKYFSGKRYSTIAGTLVYFLLMSVAPFLFWLTLLAGKVDLSFLFSGELADAVEPFLSYLQSSAESATSGAGIVLLVTSLWSSTNFFYHLRRSGEIIYGEPTLKGGLRLRLSSLLIVFAALVLAAAAAAVPFLSFNVLNTIMPEVIAQIISITFVTLFSVFGAYLLNLFACPYKIGFDNAMPGSLLTVALWLVSASGFTVYLTFANPQKLYGAIAAIIVFLLWCYVMVNSLVIGIIYNSKYLPDRTLKKVF